MRTRAQTFGKTLRRLWHHAPVLTLIIGVSLVFALVFALRLSMAVWH